MMQQFGRFIILQFKLITAMDQQDFLSESFELDNLVSKSTPNRNQPPNPSVRTRFTILSDMNEGMVNKKAEEQSLLSRYLKDLHQENLENAARPNGGEARNAPNTPVANLRKEAKENDVNQGNWKKKNGKHLSADPQEDKPQEHYDSRPLRSSKNASQCYGIFVYRKKIDLNKPIDFQLEDREPNRIYGESRNSSKQALRSDCFQTFGQALSRKKRPAKLNEHHGLL